MGGLHRDSDSRIETQREGGVVRLTIHHKRMWGAFVFLCVWSVGWAAGEWHGWQELLAGRGGAFLKFWLTFWTVGGLVAFGAAGSMIAGRDIVEVEDRELRLRRKGGWFGSTLKMSLSDVSDWRVLTEEEADSERAHIGEGLIGFGQGRLGFEWESEHQPAWLRGRILVRFGKDLDEREAAMALAWLRQHVGGLKPARA